MVTLASLLQANGYHTYMTGKWHLGHTPDLLPFARGFDRTIAMADTGADNWEQRTYLPIYDQAHWYADGNEHTLPDDFYSSEYFIDKTIEFIASNKILSHFVQFSCSSCTSDRKCTPPNFRQIWAATHSCELWLNSSIEHPNYQFHFKL